MFTWPNIIHSTLRRSKTYNSKLINETLRSVSVGSIEAKNKTFALFAHWDPDGVVDEYVIYHIKVLNDLGFAVILISTSDNLQSSSLESVKKYVYRVIHRENKGLDFASWKLAMILFPEVLDRENLLLTNDSIYGPFNDLSIVVDDLQKKKKGLWGLNNSLEKNCNHIQSFFVWMTPEVMNHKSLESFVDRISVLEDKEEIIVNYEVGLSKRLSNSGININPLFPFNEVSDYCRSQGCAFQYQDWVERGAFNTTIFSWDILLKEFSYPYIKTEVFKLNRFDSNSVKNWRDFIPPTHLYLIPAVEKHLQRVSPTSKAL